MATYAELQQAASDATLIGKVKIACIIAADAIRTEAANTTNHAFRLKWAKQTMLDPERESSRMIWVAIAANQGATLAQLLAATDGQIQTAVNNSVDVFATGSFD